MRLKAENTYVLDILDFDRHLVGFRVDLAKSCGRDFFGVFDAIRKVLWEEFSKQISVVCDKIKIRENVRCGCGGAVDVAQACAAGDAVFEAAVEFLTRRNCPFNNDYDSIKVN